MLLRDVLIMSKHGRIQEVVPRIQLQMLCPIHVWCVVSKEQAKQSLSVRVLVQGLDAFLTRLLQFWQNRS